MDVYIVNTERLLQIYFFNLLNQYRLTGIFCIKFLLMRSSVVCFRTIFAQRSYASDNYTRAEYLGFVQTFRASIINKQLIYFICA
jgi:hypothetical protein